MNLHILASGSSGNCSCLECKDQYIFIDAGVPVSKINKFFGQENLLSKKISMFITHEHTDHISGLIPFARSFPQKKIYTAAKTAEILVGAGLDEGDIFVLEADTCYDFEDFSVTPFNLSHDAAEPFGYRFDVDDKVFSIATDFGAVTDYLLKSLEGTNSIMLEANYEEEILQKCSYPWSLKSRISSIKGHLSNKEALKTVGELSSSGLQQCFFAHISENGNSYSLLDRYVKICKECYRVEAVTLRKGDYSKLTI